MINNQELGEIRSKRYYRIGEVASIIGISTPTIRFWEQEFSSLKIKKNDKGDRRYTYKDIEQIKLIHHLLKEKGFTLEGAREEIKKIRKEERQERKLKEKLLDLRGFLTELKSKLG